MKLFQRLFGKFLEETVESKEKGIASNPLPENKIAELDELDPLHLDPTTRPLSSPGITPSAAALAGVEATRQLSLDTYIGRKTERISFGQISDVGLVRSNNQDAAISFVATSHSVDERPNFGFFIVADGMGGHIEGEKASAVTTRVVASLIMNEVYLPMLARSNGLDRPPLNEILVNAVQKANKEVLAQVPEGGTTVTAVVIVGDLAHVAHVGDSRAYLITGEGVEQITRDHSLVQRLIELGQLTPEEAATHTQKNVLYRALGQAEIVEVDTLTRRLQANSRLLVCSDGLWGLVTEPDLLDICMKNADPQQACEKLVALANAEGGIDNITVILLNIN